MYRKARLLSFSPQRTKRLEEIHLRAGSFRRFKAAGPSLAPSSPRISPNAGKISQAAIDCAGTTVVIGGDTFAKSFRELGGRSVYYAEE